uniref:flocculation protein FLO11-like n=1 Tax=Osmia lignaria TaxID=473952 RepID=UPI0014781491|nr:flocculation protein FLO11-like [Osmia lignaria]
MSNTTSPQPNCTARGNDVVITFPFPETFPCPFCNVGVPSNWIRSAVYQRHEDLGKHLRIHHPGAKRKWVCGVCFFTDDSVYALKKVRKHHADSHKGSAEPRAAGARPSVSTSSSSRDGGSAPPAEGDCAEKRPQPDAALAETTQRPSPSPLETAGTTTRGGALTRAAKSTPTNSRTTVAAKTRTAPKKKPVITSSVTGRNLLTSWAVKTTATRKSGTPSSPADGRPPPTGSPATPPTVDLTTPPAGTGAAKRTSGGPASMRRPSGGVTPTLTPPLKEKEKSPGSKRRSTRATTEPPQPGPPRRTTTTTTTRKVSPAVTYAEVTRGTSTVTTTMTTRRMARATSLPPVPRQEEARGASTTLAPPTRPVTATCTFATAGTLTLTTTSVYSKPVAVVTVASRRSGGGTSPRGHKKRIQQDTVLLESAPTTRARAARATTEPPRTPPRTRNQGKRSPPTGCATVSDMATQKTPEERPVTRRSTRAKTLSPGSTLVKMMKGDGPSTLPSPITGRTGRRNLLPAIAEASPAIPAAPVEAPKSRGGGGRRREVDEEEEDWRDVTPRNMRRRAGRQQEEGALTTPSPKTPARQPRQQQQVQHEEEVVRGPRVVK